MIAVGLALGALAGLEVSIREHFAGYRSHTALLAGAVGIAVLVALSLLVPSLWLPVALVLAVAAFAATAWALARAFRRRSGLAFKVR
jgi:Kef-type K+ transport system membrane component KefB